MRPLLITALAALVTTRPMARLTLEPATVEIKTFQFAPETLHVRVGAHVRWVNRDEIEHTVTAGSPESRSPFINRVLNEKGATVEITLDQPGTFNYFCDRHQFMRGTLTVTR